MSGPPSASAGPALQVAALTTGRNDPSARFRVRQHLGTLAASGLQVREFCPRIDKHAGVPSRVSDLLPAAMRPWLEPTWRAAKLATRLPGLRGAAAADVVWLNRELMPGRYTWERWIRRPMVLDVDDAIWVAQPDGPRAMARLAAQAHTVVAGNRFIAEWFSQHARRVVVVPTAIDTDRFRPGPSPSERWTIVWTGSAGNFGYLYDIEAPLDAALRRTDGRLLVIAERPPQFQRLEPARVDFRRWTPEIEASALGEAHVGLMPLPDSTWTRGKCSFKMLQYMAMGLPVVVSPVGMNRDVLALGNVGLAAVEPEQWQHAIEWLADHRGEGRAMGAAGRQLVLAHYSARVVGQRLAECLRAAAA